MQRDKLRVAPTIELGPKDVALVWNDDGLVSAYVSDQDQSDAPSQHMLMALAVMMSMNDKQLVGRIWDNFEKMMDEDIQRQDEA